MEILTLLKANIKSKKGSFISIMILTLLIVTISAAVMGIRNNMFNAYDYAADNADIGDLTIMIQDKYVTKEILDKLSSTKNVDRTEVFKCVLSDDRKYYSSGEWDGNSYFLRPFDDKLKVYNDDSDGFLDTVPELSDGEIILPYGLRSSVNCRVGDTVTLPFPDKDRVFTIKAFVQEPTMGAEFIGWKYVYISDENYSKLSSELASYDTDDKTVFVDSIKVFKSDSSMSDIVLQTEINKETNLITLSFGSMQRAQSRNYTTLFTNIITGVMLGFVLVLFVIVLIMIAHGIKSEIELDYQNLGILKSQGVSNKTLNVVIALRYLSAQISAAIIGVIAAIPLEKALSRVFFSNTGILPLNSGAAFESALLILLMLALSTLVIFIMTRKLARISPVKAIIGGKQDVYFSNRLTAPVTKKALMPSIAFRSITSDIKKYVGLILITAMLAFFAVTVNLMSESISSRNSLEAMGSIITDLDVIVTNEAAYDKVPEIEEIINKYTGISKRIFMGGGYVSVDGVQIYSSFYQYDDAISAMIKGRLPKYDNEMLITEIAADELGLEIGDKVKVGRRDKETELVITGFNQNMNDAGISVSIPLKSAKKLGIEHLGYLGFSLKDASEGQKISEELNDTYGDIIEASYWDINEELDQDTTIVAAKAMRLVIYIFSGLFALVSVMMICSKAFSQEKTDIGIYKAIGFTSSRLRRQFAVRYFIVSLIGGAIGSLFGAFFSESLLEVIFRLFGVSKLNTSPNAFTYLSAVAFVSVCVLVFSFIVSRRVKRIDVRELITE